MRIHAGNIHESILKTGPNTLALIIGLGGGTVAGGLSLLLIRANTRFFDDQYPIKVENKIGCSPRDFRARTQVPLITECSRKLIV